jgi:hypothetical protein
MLGRGLGLARLSVRRADRLVVEAADWRESSRLTRRDTGRPGGRMLSWPRRPVVGEPSESLMDQRPWWERLFDRDSPAGPVIVLVLLVLAIGFVLAIGPWLDRLIEGEKPASYVVPAALPPVLLTDEAPRRAA